MSYWEKRARCKCGKTFDAWRGSLFFVDAQCCYDCGADKGTFKIEVMRWISQSGRFWEVSKWGAGYWETKSGDEP